MLTVQRNAGVEPLTKIVFYKNGAVNAPILPGYALCYDIAEDLVPQAGEYGELQRGSVVVRPATANLEFFAGIVTKVLQRVGTGTDYSGFVEIAVPRFGTLVKAFCKSNATSAATVLLPVNDLFSLATDGVATADLYSRRSCAIAGETADTSVTAANKWTWLLGK
jgi:hypothetical protein